MEVPLRASLKFSFLELVRTIIRRIMCTWLIWLASSLGPFPGWFSALHIIKKTNLGIESGNGTGTCTVHATSHRIFNSSFSENGVVDWFERLDLQQYLKGFVQRVRHMYSIFLWAVFIGFNLYVGLQSAQWTGTDDQEGPGGHCDGRWSRQTSRARGKVIERKT